MAETRSPADLAVSIDGARQRLISFVRQCNEDDWQAAPVPGDPRPVGVICDHVAHAYEYLGGWIGDLVAGRPAEVSTDVVDELNARHAANASVTRAHVADHLRSSGDTIITLVGGLNPEQLQIDGGRVRRFAEIAIRHADDHRAQLDEALAASRPMYSAS